MHLDDKLLTRLEKLSLIKISEDKREGVINELSKILAFVDNLNELETQGVSGKFSMSQEATYTRVDEPFCESSINNFILKNAPRSEDHFFIVPKIIE